MSLEENEELSGWVLERILLEGNCPIYSNLNIFQVGKI